MTEAAQTATLAIFRPIAARPRLAALIGALCIAFSGIFYRFAEVTPATATTFRCLYGLPILALVGYLEHRRYGPLPRRAIWLAILAGHMTRATLSVGRFLQGKWRTIVVDIETTKA